MSFEKRYKIIRIIVCIVVYMHIRLITSALYDKVDDSYFKYQGRELTCSIILEGSMYQSSGRPVGFNYELLRIFADYNYCTMTVEPPIPSPDCWEKLIKNQYDILVFNLTDSIPEEYLDKLYISVPIRGDNVWIVAKDRRQTLNAINFWLAKFQQGKSFKQIMYRYFRSYRIEPYQESDLSVNALSPYDAIIKKYSKYIGMDWRLLSAVVYQESRYFMGAQSTKSAKGLMQIKQSTAARYGITDLYDPDLNVKAGALHIDYLLDIYQNDGIDSANVIKFALAAYNAGEGRIQECRKMADSLGYNANDWEEVVKVFDNMPNFSGKETRRYVNAILEKFESYKQVISK